MQRKIALAAAVLAASLVAGTAHAKGASGNDLHGWCNEAATLSICAAYVAGVMGGHQATLVATSKSYQEYMASQIVCTPEGVNNGQVVDIVKKYLTANPEKRHQDAGDLVLASIYLAFPCKK